jgi:hypothetical protein
VSIQGLPLFKQAVANSGGTSIRKAKGLGLHSHSTSSRLERLVHQSVKKTNRCFDSHQERGRNEANRDSTDPETGVQLTKLGGSLFAASSQTDGSLFVARSLKVKYPGLMQPAPLAYTRLRSLHTTPTKARASVLETHRPSTSRRDSRE